MRALWGALAPQPVKSAVKTVRRTVRFLSRRSMKLYVADQTAFTLARKKAEISITPTWRLYSLPTNYDVAVPSVSRDKLRCATDVDVISERQYVLSGRTLYAQKKQARPFVMMNSMFPALILYRIDVGKVFGSIGYAHGFYYHDIVEYFFQVFLLLRNGVNDIPVLWRDMPTGAAARLIELFRQRGISFVVCPSRLCLLHAGEFYCFPPNVGRLWSPDNSDDPMFDAFRDYRDFLVQSLDPTPEMRLRYRRIYATRRRVKRTLTNNGEIEAWFDRNGFDVLDFGAFTLPEQIAFAREAEIIVGPHGANLTNIMFMEPGSRVVEMMPRQFANDVAYRRLSGIFDLVYSRMDLPGEGQTIDPCLLNKAKATGYFDGRT